MSRSANLTLHPGQKPIWQQAGRFNVLSCGRRWGKTHLALMVVLHHLRRGRRVGWFAPNFKFLDEPWMTFRSRLKPFATRVDGQQHIIELRNGGRLDAWTLEDPDAGRSREYECVILDEAAKAHRLKYAWENAISPTLIKTLGEAWFLSTPMGRNYFYELYQRHETEPDWRSFQTPTANNPLIPAAEIEAERDRKPERVFRQEYLAEFLVDGGGVFRRVREAFTHDPLLTGELGAQYAIGVDWGRSHDFTVFAAVDVRRKALVATDRFTGVGYELQVGRLKAFRERFLGPILAEENSIGGPLLERLQRDRLPIRGFVTSNASKADVVESLALALETGALTLARSDWLEHELLAFTSERLKSGMTRYGAPEGLHDDGVMALALAWEAAKTAGPQTLTCSPKGL